MTDIGIDPFIRIDHSRSSDEIVRQIEVLILEGVLRDGARLPGERDLCQRLDVSRPVLREALKELEARGLTVSRHGGGTFVADIIGEVFSSPLIELIGRHQKATLDYLEYRRELEGLTAELAARRATSFDKEILARIIDRMRQAHADNSFEQELEADVVFHNAIGESAHNIILLHTLRSCYRLLSEGIFFNRKIIFAAPGARDGLLAQHEAIASAILAGDALAAKASAQAHIDFIIEAARDADRSGRWSEVSRLRAQQMDRDNR